MNILKHNLRNHSKIKRLDFSLFFLLVGSRRILNPGSCIFFSTSSCRLFPDLACPLHISCLSKTFKTHILFTGTCIYFCDLFTLLLMSSRVVLFNFELSYFWYPLRYRVMQYLIWKLSDMVKNREEGLVVAALLGVASIMFFKVLSLRQILRSVDNGLLLLIVTSLALGKIIQETGKHCQAINFEACSQIRWASRWRPDLSLSLLIFRSLPLPLFYLSVLS